MPSEQNSANRPSKSEGDFYDILGYHFDFDDIEPQSNLAPPTINLRFIEPEDAVPASADSNKLISFQTKTDATSEEIHDALHATLDANPPPKITWPLRDVTGTSEGGDRQIIGAPPPPEPPPA